MENFESVAKTFSLTARTKKILAVFGIILAVQSTIGFSMFILEEAMQTAMFASFSYKEVKDWEGLNEHVKVMEGIQKTAENIINAVGWLSPLMYLPYLEYLKSNEAYIKSCKIMIWNNVPD